MCLLQKVWFYDSTSVRKREGALAEPVGFSRSLVCVAALADHYPMESESAEGEAIERIQKMELSAKELI
jgi:hypothetical protein